MTASIYTDKLVEPDDKRLAFDLADTKKHLDDIADIIKNEYGNYQSEWKFYSKKSGWILKMYTKTRNVLFVVPRDACFRVVFTFGEKAANVIFISDLPETIKTDLLKAKTYAEGRTIQIEVKTQQDVHAILALIRIKLTKYKS